MGSTLSLCCKELGSQGKGQGCGRVQNAVRAWPPTTQAQAGGHVGSPWKPRTAAAVPARCISHSPSPLCTRSRQDGKVHLALSKGCPIPCGPCVPPLSSLTDGIRAVGPQQPVLMPAAFKSVVLQMPECPRVELLNQTLSRFGL